VTSPRAAYLGPAGTFSAEALALLPEAAGYEPAPLPTIRDVVLAVHDGRAARALAPIENSLEGAVNVTLDVLAFDADDVRIAGEVVLPVRQHLLAAAPVRLDEVRTVLSHPQATAQCAGWLRSHLPGAQVLPAGSTADAVRAVAESGDRATAAIGTLLAGRLYGCTVLAERIEDAPDNTTRFVWLAPRGGDGVGADGPARAGGSAGGVPRAPDRPAKTSLVFWGAGTGSPGWLVRCLSEFAFRGVNLTRIESRPLKRALGEYAFFVDLDGAERDAPVAEAIAGLDRHADVVKVLGSYPAATAALP
jgi:prephenate dehydratase